MTIFVLIRCKKSGLYFTTRTLDDSKMGRGKVIQKISLYVPFLIPCLNSIMKYYVGCSPKHKDCAELYLRENYKADWSHAGVERALKNSTPPSRGDDAVEVDEASTSVEPVAPPRAPEVPSMFKKVSFHPRFY